MKKTHSRYHGKYNAFIDSMYIEELCDTDEFGMFIEMVHRYSYHPNFYAYVNGVKVNAEWLINIEIDNDEDMNRAEELLNIITL